MTFPDVSFLPTNEFITAITIMVSRDAIFPVMLMIADEMGHDAMLFEEFRHRVIIGFDWSPTAMQKIVSAGMELASGRHTG